MTRHDDMILFCDLCLDYLAQERQMYLTRLEHYPDNVRGADGLKGGLEAIEGCIEQLENKRGDFVEQKRQYIENSPVCRSRLLIKKAAKW